MKLFHTIVAVLITCGITIGFAAEISISTNPSRPSPSLSVMKIQDSQHNLFLRNHKTSNNNPVSVAPVKLSGSQSSLRSKSSGPRRDDPFDDWIQYDDGEPYSQIEFDTYWCRVSFTAENIFILQAISLMPMNLGFSDAPCQVLVYSEDPDTRDLDELLWETEVEELEVWDNEDVDENWCAIEIEEEDWIEFDEGDQFSVLYGPAPGGEFRGYYPYDFYEDFEDFEVGDPPEGDEWEIEHAGRSYVEVSDEDAHNSEQSVRFHDSRDVDGDYCLLWLNHDNVTNGRIEFWIKIVADGDFGFRGYSNEADMQILLQFNDGGRILTNNGQNYVWADGEWEEDEWQQIEVEYDVDDDRFSIWMDGDQIVDENALLNDDPIHKLLFICFGNTSCEDVYVDDISLDLDTQENDDYGWWGLCDEASDVDRSFVLDRRDVETDHEDWDLLDGDLLIRANGEYRQPVITVSDEAIDFGAVLVNEIANHDLTVSNDGNADLIITDIMTEGQYFTDNIEIEDAEELEPEQEMVIRVSFSPEASGEAEGTLTITSNDPDNPELIVPLIGSGNQAPVVDNEIEDVEVDEDDGMFEITDLDDNFSDPDDDELLFTIEDAPEQLNISIDDQFHILSINPEENYNLPDGIEVTVVATDQPHEASARSSFRIVINSIPDPPEIIQQIEDVVTTEDADPRRYNIADLDEIVSDPDGDVVNFTVSDDVPDELHMEMNQWNLLYFTPEDDYNIPDGVEVLIIADDGTGLSADIIFQLTILPVNDYPTPFDLLYPLDQDYVSDSEGIEFIWQASVDEVEDSTVTYSIVLNFADEDHWITDLLENQTLVSRNDLSINPGDPTVVEWMVWAYDGIDSIRSESIFNLTVAPLSVSKGNNASLPTELALTGIYPNPFNSLVTVKYDLPVTSNIRLSVYDQTGGIVSTLIDRQMKAGRYSAIWDGRNQYGHRVASGVYICCLSTPTGSRFSRFVLLK